MVQYTWYGDGDSEAIPKVELAFGFDAIESTIVLWDEEGGDEVDRKISRWQIKTSTPPVHNIIANNLANGVVIVGDASTGNTIRGNAIFDNGLLGIDLANDGATQNDAGDVDEGPNHLQNTPVLMVAHAGETTLISGLLNSTPATTFIIDFFANEAIDPSRLYEGQQYLGSTVVATDTNGYARFELRLAVTTSDNEWITATRPTELRAAHPSSRLHWPPMEREVPLSLQTQTTLALVRCATHS